jgi:hypothetical protein
VIEDEDETRWNAVLGPAIWLDKHGVTVSRGDVITVTGSSVKDDDSTTPMLIATTVESGDVRLPLRDDDGRPAWRTIKLGD